MSRVGKHPVAVPNGVTVELTSEAITISSSKAKITRKLHPAVTVEVKDGKIYVMPTSEDRLARSLWGTTQRNIAAAVEGVTNGFSRKLEIQGVGFKASVNSKGQLTLSLGFSHDIVYVPNNGVQITTPKATEIVVTGYDKEIVGQTAAKIRALKKPEPFKGKGIRYENEYVRRKEAKKK